MNKKFKIALITLLFLAGALLATWFFMNHDVPVLNPKGMIGVKEKDLIITATLLMLIIVVPVLILTFVIAWRFRASNDKAKYSPDWDHNTLAEIFWWGLPCIIIVVLSIITWKSSHELNPFKPLDSDKKPLTIQVVALPWKWLFIYPEQNIATVNFVQFPEKTPLNFDITADAPMNSFWIPQLGGQIYAMAGMKTKLHLIANEPGEFIGSSANLSGRGFAGMMFTAKSTTQEEFDLWVDQLQNSAAPLDFEEYSYLARPSENNPQAFYKLLDKGLFDRIIMKYMMPPKSAHQTSCHEAD